MRLKTNCAIKSNILLAFLLCLAAFAQAAESDGGTTNRFPLLAQLTPPENTLPSGCVVSKGDSPIKGLKNLTVTTNAETFVLTDGELTQQFGTNVQAMYYAVYREKGELGILAWAFKTENQAQQVRDKIKEKNGDRFTLWTKKHYVICLWRDVGTTDECFKFFKDFLQSRVELFQRKG